MKKLLLSVAAAVMTVLGLGCVATMSPAYAACVTGFEPECNNSGTGNGNNTVQNTVDTIRPDGMENNNDLLLMVKNIINVILMVVGIVAVIMMIIGGISFITSQGDAGKVAKARNTILYGVVGLVVALLAFAIVNFVLSSFFNSSSSTTTTTTTNP